MKKLEKQDLIGALEFFDKAIDIKPDFAEAYLQRARTKFNMKDTDGALADFSEAIKYDNMLAAAYYNRGTVYLFIGEINNACKDFKKAKELNYPNIDDSFRMCDEK